MLSSLRTYNVAALYLARGLMYRKRGSTVIELPDGLFIIEVGLVEYSIPISIQVLKSFLELGRGDYQIHSLALAASTRCL